MKFKINITMMLSISFSAHAAFGAVSGTDDYIAALAQLLEQKTIGDAELVTLLEAAEDGKVVNPISPVRVETSVEHFVANEGLEELLHGEIDAASVAAWAATNIKEQDRIRKKRKQTQNKTKELWNDSPSVLSAGYEHSCAIAIDGSVECWGDNGHGKCSPPPGIFKSVSSGTYHTCGVRLDGRVECWGWHEHGACDAPSDIFVSVSAAGQRSCGLTVDGTLKCWGSGYNSPRTTAGFRSVSSRGAHTCGIKFDGTVGCWYDGDPEATPSGIFQSVSAARGRACGVRANGSIQCWGSNIDDQHTNPGSFQSVSAGDYYACGLKVDGKVLCWGSIEEAPSDVFHSISSGPSHICGVKTDGTVKCWGQDKKGEGSPPWFLFVSTGQINEVPNQYYYAAGLLVSFAHRIVQHRYFGYALYYFYLQMCRHGYLRY